MSEIYEITGSRSITEYMVIRADSHQDAAARFQERWPEFQVEAVAEHGREPLHCVGICGRCENHLFDGDDSLTDDGQWLCPHCKNVPKESCSDDTRST